jgi:hypothetical protein
MFIVGSSPPSPPSPFSNSTQYTLLFTVTVANGAIAQQTFEAYAAYVLPQLQLHTNNILGIVDLSLAYQHFHEFKCPFQRNPSPSLFNV